MMKTFLASMQAMSIIILRQLVFNRINLKTAMVDTVSVSTDNCAKIAVYVNIVSDIVMAKHNITQSSISIGDHQ